MINKKFGKDLILVIISNGVKLLSSVLTVFFIPLIFSQQDYGYYKLFLLYISYVGIFHFGFMDGIYLYYAGKNYEDLEKATFRTYTKFITILQGIIALIVLGISLFLNGDRQLIVILVGLNLIALNLTTYYQFISQITQRFKEFAVRNIIYTVFNVALIGSFYLLQINDYKLFLKLIVLINFILLLWYVFSYRDITFGKSNKFKKENKNIMLMYKLGIVLLLSNLVVSFFSTIPRQFVEILYPVEIYPEIFSNFSFAYTLMGFTGVFLSAISLVIYPTLRKSNKEELKKRYNQLNSFVIVLVFILIAAYFPMNYIVKWILPEYKVALTIFFVLAPGIAISSAASVIMHNYYKSLDMNKEFLVIGIINLGVLTLLIYLLFIFVSKGILLIAVATVVAQLIWYLSLDLYLNKMYKNISLKNILFILVAGTIFYLTSYIDKLLLAFVIYMLVIIIVILIFYSKEIYFIYSERKSKKLSN